MGSSQDSGSIVPDVGVNLALSLINATSLLWTRSDLLNIDSKGSCLGIRSNGVGRSSLNDLLHYLGSLLADAEQRLVVPSP